MVEKNLAHPSLLSTYNTERQPVARHLVTESNDILRLDLTIWAALGLQPYNGGGEGTPRAKQNILSNTPEGRDQRKQVREGIFALHREMHALGTAMGQLYTSSATYITDEPSSFKLGPREAQNPQQFYDSSTYPGRRVPHVWLNKPVPGPQVSTLDVAGHGGFTLFTGIGGEKWYEAAAEVKTVLGIDVRVVGIGYGLEWEDVYLDWARKNEIEEDGCVLIRPDFFVAWRALRSGEEAGKLVGVLRAILGRGEKGENGKVKVNGRSLEE